LRSEGKFLIISFVAVSILFYLSLSVPIFGDSLGYGYQTTNWIRNNGFTPIATGQERGEQAMGHPTFFFWIWALLSGLLGNTLWVARLLPAFATFLSLWGMYRLGELLSCRTAGWLSALALFVSPLFITQALQPMPESAVVAAVIWSIYFYRKGSYIIAAALCTLAVVLREQTIFLAGSYFIAELLQTGLKKPVRLLLFLSPALAIVITGLINLASNGYFFFPSYLGEGPQLESGWFAARLRFFGSHLMAEDFRWLLVTAALAGMMKGRGRNEYTLPFVFILLFPALFFPPERIAFLLFVTAILAMYLFRERGIHGRTFCVFVCFPALLVLFHVCIVFVSMDSALNLFRYILPAYPAVILGSIAMLFKYYSGRTAFFIGCLFIVSTAVANRSTHREFQMDTSLACVEPLLDYKEAALYAVSLGDTILVSGIDESYFASSECGVVDAPVPSRSILGPQPLLEESVEYTLVVASFMLARGNIGITTDLLPPGSELILLQEPRWNTGMYTTDIYRVLPLQRQLQ
jgi:4-amino-4-deoxy-L-arabinose transferase-like glycosyltransferase